MAGTSRYEAPFHDLACYGAPLSKRMRPTTSELAWRRKRAHLQMRLPQLSRVCRAVTAPLAIPTEWPAAILWDELVRRDVTEAASDWLLGKLGRDPSVGEFQVTGGTAQAVLHFVSWGAPFRDRTLAELRDRLLDFDFAARVVVGRCQQILCHWRDAGFDPLSKGGLGRHRLTPIALLGTLYSQGLGQPKADPQANERGLQIGELARQIRRLWLSEADDMHVLEPAVSGCSPTIARAAWSG